mmetsp:Transcript_28395/g.59485  ORF Transcript_28395/g.59485 Transcript_28395/m.59485 type:complete len:253 (-) Transcript_28395:431-1189(-)
MMHSLGPRSSSRFTPNKISFRGSANRLSSIIPGTALLTTKYDDDGEDDDEEALEDSGPDSNRLECIKVQETMLDLAIGGLVRLQTTFVPSPSVLTSVLPTLSLLYILTLEESKRRSAISSAESGKMDFVLMIGRCDPCPFRFAFPMYTITSPCSRIAISLLWFSSKSFFVELCIFHSIQSFSSLWVVAISNPEDTRRSNALGSANSSPVCTSMLTLRGTMGLVIATRSVSCTWCDIVDKEASIQTLTSPSAS